MNATVFKPEPVEDLLHGVRVLDPYRWLEDGSALKTRSWIRAQQDACSAYLASMAGVDALRERVTAVLDVEQFQQPVKAGNKLFYRHRSRGGEQSQLCYDELPGNHAHILLDPASRGPFSSARIHWVSPSGSHLAAAIRYGGADVAEIYFVDTVRNQVLPEHLPLGRARGIVFHDDGKGCYYALDMLGDDESHSIRVHCFGEDLAHDRIIFSMPRRGLSKLLVLGDSIHIGALYVYERAGAFVTDLYLASKGNNFDWRLVFSGMDAKSLVMLSGGRIFRHNSHDGSNGHLIELAVDGRQVSVLIPESTTMLQEVSIRNGIIYATHFNGTDTELTIWNRSGRRLRIIATTKGGSLRMSPSLGSLDHQLFYTVEDYSQSPVTFCYDPDKDLSVPWKGEPADKRLDCEVVQREYKGRDQTRISVTLVTGNHRLPLEHRHVLMNSYGGFGLSMTPKRSPLITILMELGMMLVVPHIRGGRDGGENWHQAAVGSNRQIAFDDFLDCALWLHNQTITAPGRLASYGGSNAGLLVAAAMTQRPDLFRAVICVAPLLDMVRYQKFDRAGKWKQEYGSPDVAEEFAALYAYSPYHHVQTHIDYPAALFVTGDQDDRCNPAHVRKMAASLQGSSAQKNPILVDYGEERGHSAVMPLHSRIEALTLKIAFLCKELGIELP